MNDFRRILETFDIDGYKKYSQALGMPEAGEEGATFVLHFARTQAESLSIDKRAWSHAWLTERGLPTGLPDELRPKAERLYPREVTAVGVSVKSLTGNPIAGALQSAMSNAVAEMYADGITEPSLVKSRMMEAYRRVLGAD